MFKGELYLGGGNTDTVTVKGSAHKQVRLIAYGETREEMVGKVAAALAEITMAGGVDCNEAYRDDVAKIPGQCLERLSDNHFSFFLNYDSYDNPVSGARWEVTQAYSTVIVLQ